MTNFNLKPVFSKKERWVVFFYSIFLIISVFLPFLYGILITPQNKIFTWVNSGYSDLNAYYAWTNQYSQGKILAEIFYTTEPHPALFFHPVFFLAGQINRFLKIQLEIIFLIFSFLANFFLLITLYYFISHFLDSFSLRLISFLFVSLSGGLGWFTGLFSADLFLSEITFLRILHYPFIMSLGLALLLWSLLFFVKSLEERGLKKAILSGFFAFLLVSIHPYDIVIFYALSLFYLFFFTKFWRYLNKIFIVFLFPLPIIVYNFLVNYSHFVWHEHSLTPMLSPPFLSYLLGLFPSIFFAFFALKYILKERRGQVLLLWSLAYFFLLYLPVPFQWKLSLGISIPLGILAGVGLDNLCRYLNKKSLWFYPILVLCFLVLIFSCLTNILWKGENIKIFQKKDFPSYLSKEIKGGFDWLRKNTSPYEAVFSSYEMGSFIPRYSGNKVFLGHWAQTVFAQEKKELVESFFSGKISEEQIKNLLKIHKIKYIFYSDFEKKFGSPDLNKFGQEVFKNNSVSIFKINL